MRSILTPIAGCSQTLHLWTNGLFLSREDRGCVSDKSEFLYLNDRLWVMSDIKLALHTVSYILHLLLFSEDLILSLMGQGRTCYTK